MVEQKLNKNRTPWLHGPNILQLKFSWFKHFQEKYTSLKGSHRMQGEWGVCQGGSHPLGHSLVVDYSLNSLDMHT